MNLTACALRSKNASKRVSLGDPQEKGGDGALASSVHPNREAKK